MMLSAQPDGEKIKDLTYFRHPQEELNLQDELIPQQEFDSQSGLVEQDGIDDPLAATQLETIASESVPEDQTMNVFFGENVTSIRELVKRYVMTRYWVNDFALTLGTNIVSLSNKTFPYQRGYDSEGIDTKQFGSYNVSNMNPINYFQACYAGYRGSIRHKYLYHTCGGMNNPVVERENYSPDTAGIWSVVNLTLGELDTPTLTENFSNTTWQGAASSGLMVNNGIEVEFPFYNKSRIGYTRLIKSQDLDCPSTTTYLSTRLDNAPQKDNTNRVSFQQWTAAGEDFSFYFFTGVPIMYQYSN
jgi:hypothetical protein